MSSLQNKIDFVALVSVTRANSNGDPLNGNRPRTDLNGFGEISDVCIKRKIRNRMQDLGNALLVGQRGLAPFRQRQSVRPFLRELRPVAVLFRRHNGIQRHRAL